MRSQTETAVFGVTKRKPITFFKLQILYIYIYIYIYIYSERERERERE